MVYQRTFDRQIEHLIHEHGRDADIVWGTTVNCSSCGYDPINKEAINSFCSTCNGLFFYETESTLRVKGVLKTFVGNLRHIDYSLQNYGYIPEHEARLTCWLDDVLVDFHSATGQSYLDVEKNTRVQVDAKKYKVKGTFRSGVDNLKVIIATLEEIKSSDTL